MANALEGIDAEHAVTANRTGTELRKDGSPLTFIGMSQIVAPDSTVIERAPAKGTAIMISDTDLKNALNKSINAYNDLFKDRRPEMYQPLESQETSDN